MGSHAFTSSSSTIFFHWKASPKGSLPSCHKTLMSFSSEAVIPSQAVRDKTDETNRISVVAVVDGIDDDGASWKEIGDVFSYSACGVGFYMPRPCHVGHLVSLRLQLPHHLRCYDHDEELYQIWGLVQSCYMSITAELA